MAKKAEQVWGRRSAAFYADLAGRRVNVATVAGKVFSGTLVGVDTYDVIVRQGNGLEILFPKGNVLYVHLARGEAEKEE